MESSNGMPHTDELDEQTIVPQMLNVQAQRLARPNEKSLEWFDNLKCLSMDPEWDSTLRLEVLPHPYDERQGRRKYIAVSYCCEPMWKFEKDPSKTFWIHDVQEGSIIKSATRDLVITRVHNYAKDRGYEYFWIAEDCINQSNDEAKLLGMNSMDLVYDASQLSLGLLSIVISEASDMQRLQVLLSGGLVHFDNIHDLDVNIEMCTDENWDHTMELLERIRDDNWWNRQWIFQEEYLAGTKMILLIRHDPELEDDKRGIFEQETANGEIEGTPGVTTIKGELCIEATHFRAEVTKFLLAQLDCKNTEPLRKRCKALLDTFGKYNLLYEKNAPYWRKAMSSRIFADLERRAVSVQHDLLPIAANICNYGIRVDPKTMAENAYSVKFCALMMCIFNGEIIIDRTSGCRPQHENLAQLLDRILFDGFDPPVDQRQLTWLKECRLTQPILVREGILTVGLLWKVREVLHTRSWDEPPRPTRKVKRKIPALDESQLGYMDLLVRELYEADHENLAQKLEIYLSGTAISEKWSAVKEYKNLMSEQVIRAIEQGHNLYIASPWDSEECSAIFVGLSGRDRSVFTSWSETKEEDGRHRIRHVSLQVEVAKDLSTSDLPLIRFIGPGNGLALFTWREQKKVIVQWPKAWRPQNEARKHIVP